MVNINILMKSFVLAGLSAVSLAAEENKTCKALVMSGGGSNGAWEAGVIYGFANYGNASDFEWDVISGVSAGSINALAIAV